MEGEDLDDSAIVFLDEHEEAGKVRRGVGGGGSANGGFGVLEVDLDDNFVESIAESTRTDHVGEVLAGSRLLGGGVVSRRRSSCTRGIGGHCFGFSVCSVRWNVLTLTQSYVFTHMQVGEEWLYNMVENF